MARTVVVLGAVLAGVAIAAILWRRGEPGALAADGDRHAAANGSAAVETTSAPAPTPTPTPTPTPNTREPVAPAATGGSRTVLRGTVRRAGTSTPVRRGALFVDYVDCVAAGVAPETLVGRDPEQLSEHRADRRARFTATGDYELELPGPILLMRIRIEPPDAIELARSREQICFDGFERLEVPIREAITAPVWQRDFEVAAGGSLVGFTVEARSGVPVAGALVRAAWVYTSFDLKGAYSDARGAFAVTGLPAEPVFPDAKLEVRVSCTGFLDRELRLQPAEHGPTQVMIELERAVLVSGRVVDPEGHGVAGATVDAVAFGGGPTPFGQPLALVQSTQSDAVDGSFTFSLPPVARLDLRAEGSYRVSVESMKWTSGVGRLAGLESLRDQRDLRLELRSQAAFHVSATLPDGSVVPERDLVVLVEDDGGWRGAYFTAPAAVEHTIRVLAPAPGANDLSGHIMAPKQAPGDRRAFRGSTRCMSARTDGTRTEVAIALEPWQPEVPPALPPETSGEKVMSYSADVPGQHACFVRDLTLLDDATGEPLANRGFSVGIGLSSCGGQTSSRGRVRLAVGPGTTDLTVRVDGCRPQAFRVANPVTGYAAIDVRLQRAAAERR